MQHKEEHEKEVWKDVPGYEGRYQVSNLGQVKGLDYIGVNPKGLPAKVKGRVLKTDIIHCGYHRVTLSQNNKRKNFLVHRLVIEAFVPNPDNKPEANHEDCDKNNNRFDNLGWTTKLENMRHAIKNGRRDNMPNVRGEENHNARLNNLQVRVIKKCFNDLRNFELAAYFNVPDYLISNIRGGRTWKHI